MDLDTLFDNSTEEKAATAKATVMNGKKRLIYGTDFTIEPSEDTDHESAGKHSVVIIAKAKENPAEDEVVYVGTHTATYEITGVPAKKVKLGGFKSTVEYTGDPIAKTAYRYYYAEDTQGVLPGTKARETVTRLKDSPVGDTDILPAGALIRVEVTVTAGDKSPYAAGDYELKTVYRIVKKTIGSAKVSFIKGHEPEFDNGQPVVPIQSGDLLVKIGKTPLEPTDYEIVSITNNQFLRTASMTIRGCGNYGGTKTFTFKIRPKAI
ncbi:MAG: hypothetical protein K6F53_10020 [Lachnospiraceae bacterium]|nr:hypothetical protein [Lachnospiraceae bacterium]